MNKFKTLVLNTAIGGSLIAAAAIVVQLHLWQARAPSLAGAPADGLSSLIYDLHGHTKSPRVQTIDALN